MTQDSLTCGMTDKVGRALFQYHLALQFLPTKYGSQEFAT